MDVVGGEVGRGTHQPHFSIAGGGGAHPWTAAGSSLPIVMPCDHCANHGRDNAKHSLSATSPGKPDH